jgi:hypothetical protein
MKFKMKFWDWFHFQRVYTWHEQIFKKKTGQRFDKKDQLKIYIFEKKYF